MDPNHSRVNKLLQEGVINPEQAKRLHSSMGRDASEPPVQQRRALPWPWITAVILALLLLSVVSALQFNTLEGAHERVNHQHANLLSQYQRRHDLIPQLISLVKRYLKHEQSTLKTVFSERGKALQPLQTAVENLQSDGSSQPIQHLFLVAEQYPDLQEAEQFQTLQAQIEGTENRINIARIKLNQSINEFNALTRKIPGRWLAQLSGYDPIDYPESDPQVRAVPNQNW